MKIYEYTNLSIRTVSFSLSMECEYCAHQNGVRWSRVLAYHVYKQRHAWRAGDDDTQANLLIFCQQ